jgi:hypothetical protein
VSPQANQDWVGQLGTDPATARWGVNIYRNSTLATAEALELCAAAQLFTPRAVIRRRRSGACASAAWIGTRTGSRQDYAVPNGRTLMRPATGMEIAHGFIQRRLGGKLWQAQLMPPIPAYVQRSEFGCGFSTKNRSLWPTITRAQRFRDSAPESAVPQGLGELCPSRSNMRNTNRDRPLPCPHALPISPPLRALTRDQGTARHRRFLPRHLWPGAGRAARNVGYSSSTG